MHACMHAHGYTVEIATELVKGEYQFLRSDASHINRCAHALSCHGRNRVTVLFRKRGLHGTLSSRDRGRQPRHDLGLTID